MGHQPSEQSLSAALRALLPALLQLPAPAAAELLPALLHATTSTRTGKARPPRSPTAQEVLGPLGRRVVVLADRDDDGGGLVTALVVGLVRLSAAWGVPLEQEEVLGPLARVVEWRLRRELPPDSALLRSDDFRAFMVGGFSGQGSNSLTGATLRARHLWWATRQAARSQGPAAGERLAGPRVFGFTPQQLRGPMPPQLSCC